jgi:Transposase IS66 family
LDKREAGLAQPLARSDALLSNEGADASRLMRCHCLAHGRRKCSDLAEVFPHECPVVLDVLRQVCDHAEQARQAQRSPEARLASPQAQSPPLLDALKHGLDQQRDDRLVEPNRALGKAIGSMRTHGQTLRRFLSGKGAPLDTNLAERGLKLCIRQRKHSLFYKSPHSAYIASVLTSRIATCLYGGVNAVASLVALQEHRPEVFADPGAWLPWTYQESRSPPQGSLRQS